MISRSLVKRLVELEICALPKLEEREIVVNYVDANRNVVGTHTVKYLAPRWPEATANPRRRAHRYL
jgi:hypothetical protein